MMTLSPTRTSATLPQAASIPSLLHFRIIDVPPPVAPLLVSPPPAHYISRNPRPMWLGAPDLPKFPRASLVPLGFSANSTGSLALPPFWFLCFFHPHLGSLFANCFYPSCVFPERETDEADPPLPSRLFSRLRLRARQFPVTLHPAPGGFIFHLQWTLILIVE